MWYQRKPKIGRRMAKNLFDYHMTAVITIRAPKGTRYFRKKADLRVNWF